MDRDDILNFISCNIDEIKQFLNEETSHLAKSECLFKEYPMLYDELLENYRKHKLIEYLDHQFPNNFETIYLLIDELFVKISLYC